MGMGSEWINTGEVICISSKSETPGSHELRVCCAQESLAAGSEFSVLFN